MLGEMLRMCVIWLLGSGVVRMNMLHVSSVNVSKYVLYHVNTVKVYH